MNAAVHYNNCIITGHISKIPTRTPPREYTAWWSQAMLSVYRLDDKKDICGLASLVLFSQSLQIFIMYYSQSIYLCPALSQIVSTIYTSLNNRCRYQSITQQHLNRCLIKDDNNHMFRPIVAIIRFSSESMVVVLYGSGMVMSRW